MSKIKQANFLKSIGVKIATSSELSDEERIFISNALIRIGEGEDSASVLGINLERGEKDIKKQKQRQFRNHIIGAWIKLAMTPTSDGGKGWTLEEAIAYLEEDNGIQRFGIKAETIRRIWNNNKNIRKLEVEPSDLNS